MMLLFSIHCERDNSYLLNYLDVVFNVYLIYYWLNECVYIVLGLHAGSELCIKLGYQACYLGLSCFFTLEGNVNVHHVQYF